MFKNTYLGNSDNGLFVVFSRMNDNTEELDVSIADLICYAGKRPIILWKDDSAYSLTKVETSYDAQADETTVVAVFGDNGYKVVVSGAVNSGSKGTFEYDAASSGSGSTGGDPLVVHEVEENLNIRLDKTWQEIINAGFSVLMHGSAEQMDIGISYVTNIAYNEEDEEDPEQYPEEWYVEYAPMNGASVKYSCAGANEYPIKSMNSGDI